MVGFTASYQESINGIRYIDDPKQQVYDPSSKYMINALPLLSTFQADHPLLDDTFEAHWDSEQ